MAKEMIAMLIAGGLGSRVFALSAELGKMKKEGLLDFWKNQFVLKTKE